MIVSLLGLVISLFAYLIAFPDERTRRFDIYASLLALHILGSIAFWLMSFESAMDAFLYYRDPYRFINENPFGSGTYFVVHFVQGVRNWLGGSFLDHFLLFQCFGMIAMALLIRSLNEIALSLETSVPLHVYLTLFLPGLHFWTAGIGKDGPMLMAISLAGWAVLKLDKRFIWLGIALLIMVCIRPHITPMVGAGVAAALFFNKRVPPRVKLFLSPIAAIGLVVLVGKAATSLGISVDADSVTGFVEGQQQLGDRFGSGANLADLPLPLKVLSLLYRPFWFDAQGMTQYAASLENSVLLWFTVYLVYHWKLMLHLARNVFFVTYFLAFDALLVVSLAMVSYNIGMGQRMKMMAVPGILILYGTLYIYKRALASRPAMVAEPPPPEPASHKAPVQA
jgi:hypothetical protein